METCSENLFHCICFSYNTFSYIRQLHKILTRYQSSREDMDIINMQWIEFRNWIGILQSTSTASSRIFYIINLSSRLAIGLHCTRPFTVQSTNMSSFSCFHQVKFSREILNLEISIFSTSQFRIKGGYFWK